MSGAPAMMGAIKKIAGSPWTAGGLQAFGAITQGRDQANSLAYNAAAYRTEAGIASAQGYEQEARQRQLNAEMQGRDIAAEGQAGVGYGGSSGDVVRQNAANAELDARTIRYKSSIQRWAYMTQADNLQREARSAGRAGALKAGAALLRAYGNYV